MQGALGRFPLVRSNKDNNNNSPVLNSVIKFYLCNARIHYVCFAVPPAYYAHLAAFRARYYIEGDSSDSGSTSSGGGNVEIQRLPSIKENVKDVMFYCWACERMWLVCYEFWFWKLSFFRVRLLFWYILALLVLSWWKIGAPGTKLFLKIATTLVFYSVFFLGRGECIHSPWVFWVFACTYACK